jgi:hypothetical protein
VAAIFRDAAGPSPIILKMRLRRALRMAAVTRHSVVIAPCKVRCADEMLMILCFTFFTPSYSGWRERRHQHSRPRPEGDPAAARECSPATGVAPNAAADGARNARQTLQPTALVHEARCGLVAMANLGVGEPRTSSRQPPKPCGAFSLRARWRQRIRHGGDQSGGLDEIEIATPEDDDGSCP